MAEIVSVMAKDLPGDLLANPIPSGMQITWAVTRSCNYKCPYCTVNKEEMLGFSWDYDGIMDYIIRAFSGRKHRYLTLFGGEPTLYSDLPDLVWRGVNEAKANVSVFTNLSHSIEYYKILIEIGAHIETSYHGHVSPVDFINKVTSLPKDALSIYVMQDSDSSLAIFKEISALGYRVELHAVNPVKGYIPTHSSAADIEDTIGSVVEDAKYLRVGFDDHTYKDMSFAELTSVHGLNNFHLWRCYAGAMNLFIEPNGDVFDCQVYANMRLPKHFNLFTDPQFPTKPVLCKAKECTCELFLPKYRVFGRKR